MLLNDVEIAVLEGGRGGTAGGLGGGASRNDLSGKYRQGGASGGRGAGGGAVNLFNLPVERVSSLSSSGVSGGAGCWDAGYIIDSRTAVGGGTGIPLHNKNVFPADGADYLGSILERIKYMEGNGGSSLQNKNGGFGSGGFGVSSALESKSITAGAGGVGGGGGGSTFSGSYNQGLIGTGEPGGFGAGGGQYFGNGKASGGVGGSGFVIVELVKL